MIKFYQCMACTKISTAEAINKATARAYDSKKIKKIKPKFLRKHYYYNCPRCGLEHQKFRKVTTWYSKFLEELADLYFDKEPGIDDVIKKAKEYLG